ncbi:MAG: laccase domain-containing protein [Mogibacterium sp.]|nr:laccase domain-containing protein [Mogibacterium sp.]MBR2706354.1 laccase domain-containing protein [Mogibacterium sp.]
MKLKYSDENKIFSIHTDGIPYLSFDMLDGLGVPNLFTTRYIKYDEASGTGEKGLRLAVMKTETVEEASPVCRANRDILAHQLGSSLEMELVTDQKHTNYVHVATCEEDLGVATVGSFSLHRQFVDGIVTDIPDALLTVFGGDCPPVYIVDPKRRAAGLVHAGWKGTLGKIPQVAIAQMAVKFGCDPADMYAAIGPGVCRDCYEMGDEVYDAFAEQWSREDADRILSRYPAKDADGNEIPGGKYHLDLREANKLTLMRAGVPADHIAISNVCTMCNVDTFYSYRGRALENEQVAMMVNRFDAL